MKNGKRPSGNKKAKTSLRAPGAVMLFGGLLFCAGFLFVLSLFPAAQHTGVLKICQDTLYGIAGGTWFFFFPLLLLFFGVKMILSLYHDVSFRNTVLLSAIYVLALGLMTIVTVVGNGGSLMSFFASQTKGDTAPSYLYFLRCAFDFGANDKDGQGALGMLIAYPVWRFLGTVGAVLLLSVALLVLVGVLLRLHPGEWINRLSNWTADRRDGSVSDEVPMYAENGNPLQDSRSAPLPAFGSYQAPPPAPERAEWQEDKAPDLSDASEGGYYPVTDDQYYVENFGNEKQQEPEPERVSRRNRRTQSSTPKEPPVFPQPVQDISSSPSGFDQLADVPLGSEWHSASGQTFPAAVSKAPETPVFPDTPANRKADVFPEPEPEPVQQMPGETEGKKRSGILKWPEFRKNKEQKQNDPEKKEEKQAPASPEKKRDTGSWLDQLNQRKREASMAPADSQMTDAVSNGARPVFTANAVEETFEHVPIQPSAGETSRRGDRLDGTSKKEMPSIQVVSDVEYHFPPIELLHQGIDFNTQDHTQEDQSRAQKIEETLKSFNIESKVMQVMHGPAITRFAIQIAPGIRVQRVTGMADNLALSLATKHVRVEAPIQGTNFIGIEVPNKLISTVSLREVLDSREMKANRSPLAVSLGKDIAGTPVICDLSKMPHLLIAGATGSGKSVCIHSIVCSLLYRSSPKDVRLIMVDPKQVELSVYNGVPHLLIPVVTDVRKASGALGWVVQEMQDRYAKFKEHGVRNLEGYNKLNDIEEKLPNIVVIIDEMADLMDVCRKDVEESIRRLAALARAAGIYMVLATQRPSVDVITGVIKNNIPSRIAFAVSSGIDSRTILDTFGAEKLMGKGDMLYKPSGASESRVQGSFVSDDEVSAFTDYIRERHAPEYDETILEHVDKEASKQKDSADMITAGDDDETEGTDGRLDGLLNEAIQMAIEDGQTSTSMLQRRLRIGYARAGRLVDEMEKRGVVSAQDGSKPRKTLMTREQYYEMVSESEEG